MIARLRNSCHLLRFILFHVIFILLAKNNTMFGFTDETDQQALLAVKDLIQGDPFSFVNSWNHSLHFCHWKGVTCSRRHQRVIMLDLSSLSLVGSLSPQIGNLTFIREIYFQNNSFHGAIPQEIGQLYCLRHLRLHNNAFQGTVPTNFSYLDIKELNLDRNDLEGNIPKELGYLSNLRILGLYGNNFIGPIPPSLGNLSSLRTLSMERNNLVGNIPWQLCQLSNLERLRLGENNLTGTVPLPLYNISSIRSVGLHYNQLQGNLPPDLGLTLPNLIYFLVQNNKLSGLFPPSISNASGLVGFSADYNNFSGPLPMNLGSLRNLEFLQLYGNEQLGTNDTTNDLSFMIKSLINCTNLRSLNLAKTGFRGELPYSIVNLSTTLEELALGLNYLSGSIPDDIGKLTSLNRLGLRENMLSSSIPKSIGKLSKLEALYLSANNLSGEIPYSFGNITRLAVLYLQRNKLEGSIPVTLGNLTNLLELNLSNNRLTGVIPEQVVGLSSTIIKLVLYHNQLTGVLPFNIGSLKNLGVLDVSENRLTGEIPSSLGNCLMLELLYMDDNLFHGTIPSSFKNLKSITFMDLSRNNLSGQIQSFLGELDLFQLVNLSHNKFEGEVPTKGVFSNVRMFSIVGNLEFCGGIQALQLPTCYIKGPEEGRKSFPRRRKHVLIIVSIVVLMVCLALVFYQFRRSKKKKLSVTLIQNKYPKLSYGELLQATNGFSLTNIIGEGKYGSVYKGILNSGEQVAVKVLNLEIHGANTCFLAECEISRNTRHRNLIKIITSCSSVDFKGSDFKALVLEFMSNGSLDNRLHPTPTEQQNDKNLTLLQRLSIAIDVASAVDYLHNYSQVKVVHCDLKPGNILLDEEFTSHVGDFGLARILSDTTSEINHPHTSSLGIRGTTGYVPPEYGMGSEISPQGDVYSYGILLLEMFTGKRPTNNMFSNNVSLGSYVRNALPQNVMKIVDARIIMESDGGGLTGMQSNSTSSISMMELCLMSVLQIGILCCAERPRERMNIRDVFKELTITRNLYF